MLYSMDAIVNWMSLWKFKSVRDTSLSITIRAIVGKGWGQGPQHSKSFHSWFANLPGIRVAIPSNPYDAKGLLIESIFSKIPTIIIADKAPVLPSSNVEANALGISATIPENIINEIPLPTPRIVICSPSHIRKVVPATKEIVVINLKEYPGSITKLPAFSRPTETP